MITLQSIGAALNQSILIKRAARREAQALIDMRLRRKAAIAAARLAHDKWLFEQRPDDAEKQRLREEADAIRAAAIQKRMEDALDADGSRAAAKAAREEQLKQERLDFLAAQFAIID